ncbi:hypothetical protein DOTSEDRAFT_73713 [Dothistroma septosporum NZE10]|uniref:Uncharacterized protein n=1 Tax=Dothistroma septosporum (strain NZE10 / CBS 128990) TaxID=675120 RepID=N1PIK8_DOTSN|nr:hypothetical protein DOTSEDRAFT_73713 [Dothistroma septosporum NZE10]
MASSSQSRRATHTGFDQPEQVREDRRRSTSFSFLWRFTTMEEEATRWQATLHAVISTRQQSRERFRAAVGKHAKLCEHVGPQAMVDRVLNRFRKRKDTEGPLYELDKIREKLTTLALERRFAEDQVLATIRGFRLYTNQILHRLQQQAPHHNDPLFRHEHALHLARVNNTVMTIYYSHYFGERTYAGDTAKLTWQIWSSECIIHKKSKFACEAQKAVVVAERELQSAENEYQKVYQQWKEATNRYITALGEAAGVRNVFPNVGSGSSAHVDNVDLFKAELVHWVAHSKHVFADYTTLMTFPEPPRWRCSDVDGCQERRHGRALGVCECSVREAVKGLDREDLKWVRTHFHPDKFRRCPEEKRAVFGKKAGEVMIVVNEVWEG